GSWPSPLPTWFLHLISHPLSGYTPLSSPRVINSHERFSAERVKRASTAKRMADYESAATECLKPGSE
ncbi:hypothetical protein ACBP82_12645, partial [Paenalcaligenes hominis]|uniref:hypothetical protein n=1 Tax=Paenalcaligenes hominis TaxID=643674 RepID=UPI0035233E3B